MSLEFPGQLSKQKVPEKSRFSGFYVGKLKDKSLGFQIFILSFPYKGRSIPFNFMRKLNSGLHILIKRKVELSEDKVDEIINSAFLLFRGIVLGGVRTFA